MIHVAIITASYGFLGSRCSSWFTNLNTDLLKNKKEQRQEFKPQIEQITAINEMSLAPLVSIF